MPKRETTNLPKDDNTSQNEVVPLRASLNPTSHEYLTLPCPLRTAPPPV